MRTRSLGARRAVVAALAVATFPVLAACDTSPDSAAVIGKDHISIGDLQHQVNVALADPNIASALAPGSQSSTALGGNRAGFVRVTLTRLISDQLINAVAVAHHVTVTSKEVSDATAQFVQQAGSETSLEQQAAQGVGVPASGLAELIRLTVLQQKLSDALTANLQATPAQLQTEYQKDIDQYDQLDVAQIAVTNKTLANQILTKARRTPANFGALAKRYSQDTTTQANGGEVGLVGRSQVVSLLGSAAKAKVGNIVLAHSSGEYVILHIISRQVTSIAQATTKLKAALFATQATTLLGDAITAEEKVLGVHVSPRYGHWDSKTNAVVATKSAVKLGGVTSPTDEQASMPLGAALLEAVAVMDLLRSPGGCPWDAEQDHVSLAPYLLEEAYEAFQTIEDGDLVALRDELGDVLLQVLFHARLAEELPAEQRWTIDDVAAGLVAKLKRRHPHVFADVEVSDADEVNRNWEQIKAAERGGASPVASVAMAAPALTLAAKLQRKAGLAPGDVAALPAAVALYSAEQTPETAGALMWETVAALRSVGIDPEAALRAHARAFRDELLSDTSDS